MSRPRAKRHGHGLSTVIDFFKFRRVPDKGQPAAAKPSKQPTTQAQLESNNANESDEHVVAATTSEQVTSHAPLQLEHNDTNESDKHTTAATTQELATILAKRQRLFALIIGIDNYADPAIKNLNGAVADAKHMKAFLEDDLKVPTDQIRLLCDIDASRAAIIDSLKAFKGSEESKEKALEGDQQTDKKTLIGDRIEEGDPILIYFAGHGGKLDAPGDWETGGTGRKIETLIPQDCDGKRIPPRAPDGTIVAPTEGTAEKKDDPAIKFPPIPDRTIGALIDGIAEKKGDNIIVILDCCHSGSGTRRDDFEKPGRLARTVGLGGTVSDTLDRNIWEKKGTRGTAIPAGFARSGLTSHVLLAACSANELAREEGSRGIFTTALLELLRRDGIENLRYADVLTRIKMKHADEDNRQSPQCEGDHRERVFFERKVVNPARSCYAVRVDEDGEYIMDAGSVHGIGKDAEFAVYPDAKSLLKTAPLGVLTASTVNASSSVMQFRPGTAHIQLTAPALAFPTSPGVAEHLVLYMDSADDIISEALEHMQNADSNPWRISVVDGYDKAKANLEITTDGDSFRFNILDARVTQHGLTRVPSLTPRAVDDVSYILRSAAHYHWHLNRMHRNVQIEQKITVEFFELERSQNEFDETGRSVLSPVEPNLYRDGVIDVVVKKQAIYGIKLTNNTSWDLYPNVFFFDNSDFSIIAYYKVAASGGQSRVDVPLTANGGTLTIGYGSGGARPFSYYLRRDQEIDVGFIKLFFTTKYADLSKIEQPSPFGGNGCRGTRSAEPEEVDTWGSILIPVIQRARAVQSAG